MTIKTTLPTSDWSNGITDKTIYNGVLFKTGLYNELLNNDIIIADTGIKFNCDATSIKNYLKFDGMIYTQDYSSPVISNASALTRRKIKVTGSDTYDLGKCLDIKYVARYLTSNVTEVISTTQLKVNDEVSESIENYDSRLSLNNLGGKLVCNIIDATGDHNIREFTISGGVITLSSALSSLSVNNTFELISALDILKEGLEQTTGYPDKGYCIKSIKPDSNSTIKFGYFDVPPLAVNSYIIVYTNQIAPFKPEYIFSYSIKRNCLYISNEKLDFPITQEQFDILLAEYKKYIESKKEYILTTYRPNECQIGWKIPINLNYLPKGVYTVTDVEIESIEPIGQLNGKHLIKQRVKLSNYFDNLNSLLAGFRNTSKLNQARIADAKYNSSFINFKMVSMPSLVTIEPPTLTTYSFSGDNVLTVNWSSYDDSLNFYIQLSLNSDFTNIVSEGFTGNETSITFVADYIESNNDFYVRLKVKSNINTSAWSDTLAVSKRVESYYFISTENLGYEELLFTDLDGTNQNDILTIPYAQRPIDFAVNDDYIAYSHHGTDIYGGLDMKLFNKTTNAITSIDYNIFSYNVFNPVLRGNYLYYGRNGNNIYRFNLTTFTSSSFYNAPYTLHDVSFDERYILLKYNFGFACYDTVTSTYTTAVYHSWRSARFLPNNKIIASADNGTYIFNNPSNVAVSYDFIPNTLSNGFVSDAVSNTEFITSGSGSDGNRIVRHFDIDGNLLKSVTLGSTGHVYSVKIAKKYIP